jgi:peptide/histidine transporter 3/4
MNTNHVERFYWFLAILSTLNFANYVFWAKWYKYKTDVPIDEEMLLKSSQAGGVDQSLSASTVSFISKNQEQEDQRQDGVK